MQPGECQQALRYEARILSHALGKRSLLYTVEYDTPAPADLEHAPDRRNRKRHRLYRRVDRRLAECGGFSRRGAIELHDARAPLEYLGHISRHEQSADGLTHCAAPTVDAGGRRVSPRSDNGYESQCWRTAFRLGSLLEGFHFAGRQHSRRTRG